eukprot:GHVS01073308.1.p1 GENE.GHVS01073308.1~~GHVS01073308.1.p1  ORF type:complete len:339 (+),score=98.33 GHVS01073308.1:592-1608(+)
MTNSQGLCTYNYFCECCCSLTLQQASTTTTTPLLSCTGYDSSPNSNCSSLLLPFMPTSTPIDCFYDATCPSSPTPHALPFPSTACSYYTPLSPVALTTNIKQENNNNPAGSSSSSLTSYHHSRVAVSSHPSGCSSPPHPSPPFSLSPTSARQVTTSTTITSHSITAASQCCPPTIIADDSSTTNQHEIHCDDTDSCGASLLLTHTSRTVTNTQHSHRTDYHQCFNRTSEPYDSTPASGSSGSGISGSSGSGSGGSPSRGSRGSSSIGSSSVVSMLLMCLSSSCRCLPPRMCGTTEGVYVRITSSVYQFIESLDLFVTQQRQRLSQYAPLLETIFAPQG